MVLTQDNLILYAMKGYENPYCLSENEFLEDLNKLTTIKKMITYHLKGSNVNIRSLVNSFVLFYNVFEHHIGSELIKFKLEDNQIVIANTIIFYLNKPQITNTINQDFLSILYKDV